MSWAAVVAAGDEVVCVSPQRRVDRQMVDALGEDDQGHAEIHSLLSLERGMS